MKWEEQSKEMVGTFIHKFTSPAIEQLLHTGKEKIYRYNILIVIDFWLQSGGECDGDAGVVRCDGNDGGDVDGNKVMKDMLQ